jgi:hypothetical protein
MSWIKPTSLWMMHRWGWGTTDGQEVTLAIWLRRVAFDNILRQHPAAGGSVQLRARDLFQPRRLAGGGAAFLDAPAMGSRP